MFFVTFAQCWKWWYRKVTTNERIIYKCRDFYWPHFQDIVWLKFWRYWTFPNFRTIYVYIGVNTICLWYTWGQNVLLHISASKNPASDLKRQKLIKVWHFKSKSWKKLLIGCFSTQNQCSHDTEHRRNFVHNSPSVVVVVDFMPIL